MNEHYIREIPTCNHTAHRKSDVLRAAIYTGAPVRSGQALLPHCPGCNLPEKNVQHY